MSSSEPPPPRDSLGTTFKRIVRRLIVPNNVSNDQAAIIIGSDLPPCMQSTYSSAILWRPDGTVSANNLYYFMAQSFADQGVDHGLLWYNGTNCGYVIFQRTQGIFSAPNVILPIVAFGKLSENGAVFDTQQPLFQYLNADVSFISSSHVDVDTTSKLRVFGDFLSLRNLCVNGAANATTSTNSGVFSNYPTAVGGTLVKVGGALETGFEIHYDQTFFVDNVNTGPIFAVNVNGPSGSTDYTTHQVKGTQPAVTARFSSSGMVKTGGLLAGSYTFTPRWARVVGTGSIFANSGDDWTSLKACEVAL